MNAEKLNIEKRILMTRQEYSVQRVNLESDECGEPNLSVEWFDPSNLPHKR